MPSPLFARFLTATKPYVDDKKATEVIERQLAKCGVTADTFASANLEAVRLRIVCAMGLYVENAGKREEMTGRLNAVT